MSVDLLFVLISFGSDVDEYVERVDGALPLVCAVRATPCGRFVAIGTTSRDQAIAHLLEDGFDLSDIH
jgi:hypothetical protein